jgi:hypothetical protein
MKPRKAGLCEQWQRGNARKAATGFRWLPLFCRFPTANTDSIVGARLARESVGSVNDDADWHTAFAGKPNS